MKIPFLLFLTTLIAASCGSGGGPDLSTVNSTPKEELLIQDPIIQPGEPSNLKVEITKKTIIEKNLSNLDEFKKNINTYTINFVLTQGRLPSKKIDCSYKKYSNIRENFSTNFNREGTFARVDITLNDHHPVAAEFHCSYIDNIPLPRKAEFTLLKSFIVTGETSHTSLGIAGVEKIDTLLFEKDAILKTDGLPLKISVNTLVADNSYIATFTKDYVKTPIDNHIGLSASDIEINSQNSFGKLQFNMRGQDGGKMTLVPERIPGNPANDAGINSPCNGRRYCDASASQCNGKQGYTGYTGYKGFPGFPGGNTGAVHFKSETGFISIKVVFEAGIGGTGGPGGQGGAGGQGGNGGHSVCHEHQSTPYKTHFRAGPQGNEGAYGPHGDTGAQGQSQISSITLSENDTHEFTTDTEVNHENY